MVKNENSNMSKIKDEAPNKWAFQPPNNRPSEKASEYVQKMTQNALKMANFSTQSDIWKIADNDLWFILKYNN